MTQTCPLQYDHLSETLALSLCGSTSYGVMPLFLSSIGSINYCQTTPPWEFHPEIYFKWTSTNEGKALRSVMQWGRDGSSIIQKYFYLYKMSVLKTRELLTKEGNWVLRSNQCWDLLWTPASKGKGVPGTPHVKQMKNKPNANTIQKGHRDQDTSPPP